MAKQKTESSGPAPEAREELLRAIRRSDEPLTVSQLAKLLVAPYKLTSKVLGSILDEYVAAGTLHSISPATAKGKPRYWDRDVNTLGRAAILEAMQQADGPLTAKEVAGRLVLPVKFSDAALTAMLNDYVAASTLHSIPPASVKGKPRFWDRDVLELGRLAIIKALEAKCSQTQAELKKAAKGLTDVQFQELLQRLIASRAIWPHPALGKPAKVLFGSRPPAPEPYLRDVGIQLTKVVAQLMAAKVSRDDLRRALVQLVESTGIPFGAGMEANEGATRSRPVTVDLVGLMRQIEPGAENGALVPARNLRRVAKLDKQEFDRSVLDLARSGRLSLHRHDFATSLSPAERDELVADGDGTFYVGMALRRGDI